MLAILKIYARWSTLVSACCWRRYINSSQVRFSDKRRAGEYLIKYLLPYHHQHNVIKAHWRLLLQPLLCIKHPRPPLLVRAAFDIITRESIFSSLHHHRRNKNEPASQASRGRPRAHWESEAAPCLQASNSRLELSAHNALFSRPKPSAPPNYNLSIKSCRAKCETLKSEILTSVCGFFSSFV